MGMFLRAVECWYEGYNTQAYYDIHTQTHMSTHTKYPSILNMLNLY